MIIIFELLLFRLINLPSHRRGGKAVDKTRERIFQSFGVDHWMMQPRSWLLKSALWTSLWIRSSSSILSSNATTTNKLGPEKNGFPQKRQLTPFPDCPSDGPARRACWRWPPIPRAAVSRAASAPPSSANLFWVCVSNGETIRQRQTGQRQLQRTVTIFSLALSIGNGAFNDIQFE